MIAAGGIAGSLSDDVTFHIRAQLDSAAHSRSGQHAASAAPSSPGRRPEPEHQSAGRPFLPIEGTNIHLRSRADDTGDSSSSRRPTAAPR